MTSVPAPSGLPSSLHTSTTSSAGVFASPGGMPGRATAPVAPGRLGQPAQPAQVMTYLQALGEWRDRRRAELDLLDQAAQAAVSTPGHGTNDPLTPDILLSMALWKAVADRHDLLLATWDSGRVGPAELERLATLVWGRLDTAVDPRSASPVSLSLPEACRLSDTLAASLRARLGIDADEEGMAARLRALRAQLERIRDLVQADPGGTRDASAATLRRLDSRLVEVTERARRGADVGGLVGPLDAESARLERDLIVASARRTDAARDAALARAQRTELEARGRAIQGLATRCVATVTPAPRLAVPDVAALGPVPTEPAAVDAYLTRLGAVSRALAQAQTAYQAALDEREELLGRLQGYAAKAAASPGLSPPARDDLGELYGRGQAVLAAAPTDLVRLRGLAAAYQAYLGSVR